MADKKISALTAMTAPATADFLHIIDDNSGTYTNQKVTLTNLFNKIPTWIGLAATPATFTSGAIDVTTPISFISVTGSQSFSLAAGSAGQIKILICTVAASTPVATITPAASASDGYSTVVFNVVGENATFIYANSGWNILAAGGSVDQTMISMVA